MAELISGALDALDTFIQGNYQTYLDEIETTLTLTAPADNIQDEVDLDRYRRDVEVFLVPNEVRFEPDTMDGTMETEVPIDVYVFLRGETTANLYKMLNYFAAALARMIFENHNLGGTIGEIDLNRIELYQQAEGKPGIKGLKAQTEVRDTY